MKLDPNDPRLTAYALGELDDEEHAAIEAALEANLEARAAVEEIFAAAERLTAALAEEPTGELTGEQREAVVAEAAKAAAAPPIRPPSERTTRRLLPRLAFAGAAFVAVIWTMSVIRPYHWYGWIASVRDASNQQDMMRSSVMRRYEDCENCYADCEDCDDSLLDMAISAIVGNDRDEASGAATFGSEKTYGPDKTLAQGPNKRRVSGQELDQLHATQRASERDASAAGAAELGEPGAIPPSVIRIVPTPGLPPDLRSTQAAIAGLRPADREHMGYWQGYRPPADKPYPPPRQPEPYGGEAYDFVQDNPFVWVSRDPLSTFSTDVDTASYANVRRFIMQEHRLPPPAAVRVEEMVNYFSYDYPQPTGDDPFAVHVEVADCPWYPTHRLAKIGLKGSEVHPKERPASNLVFLIDVSGSMEPANKLPLLKESMKMLAEQLGPNDRVAIVVYATTSGVALPSTAGDDRWTILSALDRLRAGGSTNGAAGIDLAYAIATENFIPEGVNRVILATDGDFNVGITDLTSLIRLIEEEAESGVFLSVLGLGVGNLKDVTLESLADKGNGHYAYIDTLNEGYKVLVQEMSATLTTIAKDVKVQVEFNPAEVAAYRLIGYENRVMADQDFFDDTKDAGEIGAGHTVTALYEIVPVGVETGAPGLEGLKYQQPETPREVAERDELMTVWLRYKAPDGDISHELEVPVADDRRPLAAASADFKFAASVAAFGMILRGSPYSGNATFDSVLSLAEAGYGRDQYGYRGEFAQMVQTARGLTHQRW